MSYSIECHSCNFFIDTAQLVTKQSLVLPQLPRIQAHPYLFPYGFLGFDERICVGTLLSSTSPLLEGIVMLILFPPLVVELLSTLVPKTANQIHQKRLYYLV